jgi:hypothetical protein
MLRILDYQSPKPKPPPRQDRFGLISVALPVFEVIIFAVVGGLRYTNYLGPMFCVLPAVILGGMWTAVIGILFDGRKRLAMFGLGFNLLIISVVFALFAILHWQY